jgi:hypothetical protein
VPAAGWPAPKAGPEAGAAPAPYPEVGKPGPEVGAALEVGAAAPEVGIAESAAEGVLSPSARSFEGQPPADAPGQSGPGGGDGGANGSLASVGSFVMV